MSFEESKTLIVMLDTDQHNIHLSIDMLESANPVLQGMDNDLDKGWQLGREFITNPNNIERCQIAANRLLTAMHSDNEASISLMAAYILNRLPNVRTVDINIEGEMQDTFFYDQQNALIT